MKKKKTYWYSGITSFILLIAGFLGSLITPIGACVLCLTPEIALILSLVSIIIGFVSNYNMYFFCAGIIFLIFSIYLYFRKQKICKACKIKKKK